MTGLEINRFVDKEIAESLLCNHCNLVVNQPIICNKCQLLYCLDCITLIETCVECNLIGFSKLKGGLAKLYRNLLIKCVNN